MLALAVLVVAWGVALALVRRPLRRLETEHVLAGRMGDEPREELIARWCATVIATAERYERLDDFRRHLDERAWAGTPLRIERARNGWHRWSFTDGDAWEVRHLDRRPRAVTRLIVDRSREWDHECLSVRAYVPGSHGVVLPIDDARHR